MDESDRGVKFRHYLDICLMGLRKTTTELRGQSISRTRLKPVTFQMLVGSVASCSVTRHNTLSNGNSAWEVTDARNLTFQQVCSYDCFLGNSLSLCDHGRTVK